MVPSPYKQWPIFTLRITPATRPIRKFFFRDIQGATDGGDTNNSDRKITFPVAVNYW